MDLEREFTNRYLLGVATEAEEEEIGVRIIEDSSFAEVLVRAENDLVEDYLEGSLSESERELFERQYLVSEERIERLHEIALLKKYAARSVETDAIVDRTEQRVPWWRNFKILVPVFGAFILLALVSLLWVGRGIDGDVDYAKLNGQDLRDAGVIGEAQIVQITPGTYRNSSSGVTVVSGTSSAVLFRLPLTFSVNAGTSFDAAIEREGRTVFRVSGARVYTDGAATEVRLLAPRDPLVPGTYQIRLTQNAASNAPVIYTFEVR